MIRLGLAGIGAIAHEYMSLIQAGMVKDVQITALSSRNPASLATAVQAHHLEGVQTFTDYSTLLTSGLIVAPFAIAAMLGGTLDAAWASGIFLETK